MKLTSVRPLRGQPHNLNRLRDVHDDTLFHINSTPVCFERYSIQTPGSLEFRSTYRHFRDSRGDNAEALDPG